MAHDVNMRGPVFSFKGDVFPGESIELVYACAEPKPITLVIYPNKMYLK